MNIQTMAKSLWRSANKNSSTILTYFAVGGVITTVGLALKAGPKALQILEDECSMRPSDMLPLTKKEEIALTWKCYAPMAITGGLTVACIVGANTINLNRTAALAGACSLAEAALKEYKSKVVEVIGENKERAMREEIAQDRVTSNPSNRNNILYTTHGDTLFFDPYSGRYFKSDIEYVKQCLNKLSRDMLTGGENICLNDVYYELDLKRIDLGNSMGWSANDGIIEADFYATKAEDEQPCLVLNYKIEPRYQYGRFGN